ncbi:OmpA family protein [Flavihumibacter fluvii]|uniref:OmpA family protein n=1 Tax=Flavihumibacter fluvii TaxID=2838157 RepID=UPI001BDE3AD4|nr:OmpA family protein [Flavihumibacter fluvii]ULQ52545.1 OmpA family protein [Flavihumibacter fluvii]
MSFNILDTVKGYITPDLIGSAASFLGESDTYVGKALTGLVPAALAGITQKAETPGGAEAVLGLAKKAFDSGILNNLASGFQSGGGGIPEGAPALLQGILGHNVGGMGNAIAQFAGIKGSSAASLLGSILPLALGLLGKHSAENGLSGAGLLSLLTSQKSKILGDLPAGLNLSGLLGGSAASAPKVVAHLHGDEPKKSGSWLMPLLLGVAAVALLLYLMKGCGAPKEEVNAVEPVVGSDTTRIVAAPTVEMYKITLPDGTQIDARQGGFEHGLVTCLNDVTCLPGKDKWFDFDDINFDLGSASLTESSMRQVKNLVAVLKSYPKAKIKIGGYTDKTGDEAVNKKLSTDRAAAVLAALKANGANEAQLEGSEGYGSDFAKIAKEASEEERRPDRRISVSLREK